jgi:hypothetical protein
MVGVDQALVNGGTGSPRKMASITKQIDTSVSAAIGGTRSALTEQHLLDLGQDCYTNGSEPSVFMIKPVDALIVAGFAASAGRNREFAQNRELVNAIDLYVSPFGEYRVIINRHQLDSHAFLIDPSMFRTVSLRPFTRTLLAKTGDSDRHMVTGEVSVKHMNTADSGMITRLSDDGSVAQPVS